MLKWNIDCVLFTCITLFSVAHGFRCLQIFAKHSRGGLLKHLEATTGLRHEKIPLANGTLMQVVSGHPSGSDKSAKNVVLLFLHGSFHGSWCWEEHFLPHFKALGYTVVAPNWRGTGGTPAAPGARKVTIAQHVSDLGCLLEMLPAHLSAKHKVSIPDARPVVVAHSFGGIALMKYMEENAINQPFRGIVTYCSVPPSGNGKLTLRYLQRSLRDSWTITRGFAMKKCITNQDMCRELFFGGAKVRGPDGSVDDFGVSDDDIRRFQEYFERDSVATIDLVDLSKKLPSKSVDSSGKAVYINELFPPRMVVGADCDFIVDKEAIYETVSYFGASAPIMIQSPHDVMLGRNWLNAADELDLWLNEKF